jgi:hypothetical protein
VDTGIHIEKVTWRHIRIVAAAGIRQRSLERFSLRGSPVVGHLDFMLLASRTLRKLISVALSHPLVVVA